MSLIDTSYFKGSILLPNIDKQTTNYANAIVEYEKKILIDLLGYKLYSLMIADLSETGTPQTQRFIDLINGAEFTMPYGGYDYDLKWNGFANTEKLSLIAYFTYYKILEQNVSLVATSGVIKSRDHDSNNVDPIDKMCQSFNNMVDLYGEIPECFGFDLIPSELITQHFSVAPSAYNFLLVNKSDYPEWVFKPHYKINRFGI